MPPTFLTTKLFWSKEMSQETIAINAGREVYYSFLSRMYIETPNESIYELLNTVKPYLLEIGDEGKVLVDFIDNRNSLTDEEKKEHDLDILRGYTRFFCLGTVATVSESPFTSVHNLVMDDSRDDALKYYRAWGYEMPNEVNEPEDHIAYELMFMSYLARKVRNNAETDVDIANKALETSKEFLEKHLLNWVGLFVKQIEDYDEAKQLYTPLGLFMLNFLQADKEYLESI